LRRYAAFLPVGFLERQRTRPAPDVEKLPLAVNLHSEDGSYRTDADELRELTKRLLERQGYAVLLAANADEALQLFERNPSVGVLLTDLVMPGGNGPELTRQLVERQPAGATSQHVSLELAALSVRGGRLAGGTPRPEKGAVGSCKG
jgi:Response regulator receiver domain